MKLAPLWNQLTRTARLVPFVVLSELLACEKAPAQAPVPSSNSASGTSSAEPRSDSPSTRAVDPARASAAPADAAAASAVLDARTPASPSGPSSEPVLLADDGKPLPQTDDRPNALSAAFEQRMRRLFDAIVHDDPKLARAVFFPLVAYEQVKDIQDAARDYRYRLLKAYERNIHEYHQRLGSAAERTTFVGVEVSDDRAKWMKPGSEGNKLGYWRVLRSKIKYVDESGTSRELELTSLISWRGEWYVVHLHGFK